MHAPIEESARSQYHGMAREADTGLRHHTCDTIALQHQIVYRLLKQPQIGLIFECGANGRLVQYTISLRTGGTHSRPLAAVENPKLDTRFIHSQCHGTTQRIQLFHQMAFANAANAGVAAHLPQSFDIVGQQQSMGAHAGCRQRRFGTGVAAAHHDNVKLLWIVIKNI